eukprot:TRINITY_DN11268_c0_g1_i2.p1 TRINITY_DN11268_c0_g1~~TRINITY_DN11268_c0_g1_i2.p1  ORF type:complete len:339 (-),score=83.87 TRINITY_DN11268_c0_g1_i2:90-1106(-)
MNCCAKDIDHLMVQKDREINEQLEQSRNKNELRILLLGTGESGKTTITKQLKQIHAGGFTEEEKVLFVNVIHKSIVESVNCIFEASEQLERYFPEVRKRFVQLGKGPKDKELIGEADTLTQFLKEEAVKKRVEECLEAGVITDTEKYYLDNAKRILDHAFTLELDDLLRVRIPSIGIKETSFSLGGRDFVLVDVGGQRSERKKWIHCFEHVNVALSEFDQTLHEDKVTNRMTESLKLFQEVCSSKWFVNTKLVLILNKADLLKKKLASGRSIKSLWADFSGANEFQPTVDYITQKFLSTKDPFNSVPLAERVNVFITCATDTECVKTTFEEIITCVAK